jgi:hypothetical protein
MRYWVFTLAALAACTDDDKAPAARVASSSPAEGAIRVGILSDVSATFDAALDPSSINAGTVSLTHELRPLPRFPGLVSYNAGSKTITLSPMFSLPNGADLTLSIDGVKDAAGMAVEPVRINFRTAQNPITRRVFGGGGQTTSWEYFTLTADAREDERFRFNGPGDDGDWFTNDDLPSRFSKTTYDAAGHRITQASFRDPGDDGDWSTGDDDLLFATRYIWEGDQLIRRENLGGPGADGDWFTNDEPLIGWFTSVDEADGGADTEYGDPGPDETWMTNDDVVTSVGWYELDADGNQTSLVQIQGAGPDEELYTEDDEGFALTYVYDENGWSTEGRTIVAAGADGDWLTNDDVVSDRTTFELDLEAHTLEGRVYVGAGGDETWGTGDDVLGRFESTNLVAKQLGGRTVAVEAGDDGDMFTSDDLEQGYHEEIRDESGARTRVITCVDPGPDGDWFTSDDPIDLDETYDASL